MLLLLLDVGMFILMGVEGDEEELSMPARPTPAEF